MQINSYNQIYSLYNQRSINKPNITTSFYGKPAKKLIEKLQTIPNDKNVHFTFDEVSKIYNYLGYNVINKRGSHMVIPLTERINLALVIPHKDKYVSATDIKRLRYVINGDIEKAVNF